MVLQKFLGLPHRTPSTWWEDFSDIQLGPTWHFLQIQDENHQLRNKIAELEKRVSDLTATNEFLLDQNAHLRMGGKSAGEVHICIFAHPIDFLILISQDHLFPWATASKGFWCSENLPLITPANICDVQDVKSLEFEALWSTRNFVTADSSELNWAWMNLDICTKTILSR